MPIDAAVAPHAKTITGDVRNDTDIELLMQISEVVVERASDSAG